jgi:hypothetical protein
MQNLPLEILIEIGLYLNYRGIQQLRQVNVLFYDVFESETFWRCKINTDFPSPQPWHRRTPTKQEYLRILTHEGGCERGSEKFLSIRECFIRALHLEDDDLIAYFSHSRQRSAQFIRAVLANDIRQLNALTFSPTQKLCLVDVSHFDLIEIATAAAKRKCLQAVQFLLNYTPTSIEVLMESLETHLKTLDPVIREYLLRIQNERTGFTGWMWMNTYKHCPRISDTEETINPLELLY